MTQKKTNTDELIDSLSRDHTPVRRVLRPAMLVTPWLVIALAYMIGVVHFLGVRMDFADKIQETGFLFELLLSLSITVSAGYCAALQMLPDRGNNSWLHVVPTTLFGTFLIYMIAHLGTHGLGPHAFTWASCFSDGLLMSFIPVTTLVLLLRKGATAHPHWQTFMAVLSVGGLGWIMLRLTCMSDESGHLLFYHFMPFILLAVVMGLFARRLFRW